MKLESSRVNAVLIRMAGSSPYLWRKHETQNEYAPLVGYKHFMKTALILLLCLPVFAAKPVSRISMAAHQWTFSGSASLNGKHPSALTLMSWQFLFPAYDDSTTPCYALIPNCEHVGYLDTPYTAPIAVGKVFSMTVNITGNLPTFGYQTESGNTCIYPAHTRFYLEQQGNNDTQEFYRWWSNPIALALTGGTWAVSAPVDPAQWSSVYGKAGNDSNPAALAGFLAAFASPSRAGVTFGGGCIVAVDGWLYGMCKRQIRF